MGQQHSPRIVTDGLVMYQDAGNPASYPGSGTLWNNLASGANNFTLTGSPVYSTANLGYFTFNGSSQWMDNPSPGFGLTGNSAMSLSCWFYHTGATPSVAQMLISYGGNLTAGDTISIVVNATTYNFGAAYNAGNNVVSNNNAYAINTWNCATITKSPGLTNTTTTLYMNGVAQAISSAASLTPNLTGTLLRVGRWINDATPGYFAGNISGAMIYNRVLTASEVYQNFYAMRGRYGI